MSTDNNNLDFILLVFSVVCIAASMFGFSFVYSENPTGSLFDSIKFSQLFQTNDGERVPPLVTELKLGCLVGIGGYISAIILYILKLFGKNFRGMTFLFILSVLTGVGTFLLMRFGLSQMISKGAAFGLSWYLVYIAFATLLIGYWYRNKAKRSSKDELMD